MGISPTRFATTHKIVYHYAGVLGDGSVSFHKMVLDARPNQEAFTVYVRRAINDRTSPELLEEGFCFCVYLVDAAGNNIPLRNTRGFQVTGFITTSDGEPITMEDLKRKVEALIKVSSFVLFVNYILLSSNVSFSSS